MRYIMVQIKPAVVNKICRWGGENPSFSVNCLDLKDVFSERERSRLEKQQPVNQKWSVMENAVILALLSGFFLTCAWGWWSIMPIGISWFGVEGVLDILLLFWTIWFYFQRICCSLFMTEPTVSSLCLFVVVVLLLLRFLWSGGPGVEEPLMDLSERVGIK